jgi:hypothetical protein
MNCQIALHSLSVLSLASGTAISATSHSAAVSGSIRSVLPVASLAQPAGGDSQGQPREAR